MQWIVVLLHMMIVPLCLNMMAMGEVFFCHLYWISSFLIITFISLILYETNESSVWSIRHIVCWIVIQYHIPHKCHILFFSKYPFYWLILLLVLRQEIHQWFFHFGFVCKLGYFTDCNCVTCWGGTFVWFLWCIVLHGNVMSLPFAMTCAVNVIVLLYFLTSKQQYPQYFELITVEGIHLP